MLNKAIIMGRLTSEPELKHTLNNVAVLSFTVAVERNYSKEGNRETDFIDAVAWRSTAEFISKYFSKGRMIGLCGSIQTRMWEDKEGKKRKSVELIVDEAYFADSKKDSAPRMDSAPALSDNDAPFETEESDFRELPESDSEGIPF